MNFAEFYDAHHSLYTEDYQFWLSLALNRGGPILELGAGTGRITLPLHMAGHEIVGLDFDIEMLRKFAANAPEHARDGLRLICGDMLSIPIKKEFRQIFFPCNTFSTLHNSYKKKLLENSLDLLADGGWFTASFPNPAVMDELPDQSDLEVEEVIEFPESGTPLQISSGWEKKGNEFTLIWGYDLLRLDGMVQHLEVRTLHYIHSHEEIRELFEDAGFSEVIFWGDYDTSAYSEDSPYLIVSAQR